MHCDGLSQTRGIKRRADAKLNSPRPKPSSASEPHCLRNVLVSTVKLNAKPKLYGRSGRVTLDWLLCRLHGCHLVSYLSPRAFQAVKLHSALTNPLLPYLRDHYRTVFDAKLLR